MERRKILAPLLISFVLVAVGTATAATTLPDSPTEASLETRTSIWDTSPGGDLNPIAVEEDIDPEDEQRAMIQFSSISFATIGAGTPAGTRETSSSGTFIPGFTAGDLRGLLYDVDYRTARTGGLGGLVTYWQAGGRYAAGSDWVDTATDGSAVGPVHNLSGYGGIAVLYDHDGSPAGSASYNGTGGGDADWQADVAGGVDPSLPLKRDEYPTINDPENNANEPTQPWLVMALAPLDPAVVGNTTAFPGASSTDVLVEHSFQPATSANPGQAKGFAWGNVIGGTYADRVIADAFGTGLDIRFDFDAELLTTRNPDGKGSGWLGEADDPFGIHTPEPTTASLLIMGLLGLLSVRRKRD